MKVDFSKDISYMAMFSFLGEFAKRGSNGEVLGLLGSMSLAQDGKPMDPAIVEDWQKAVVLAEAGHVDASLTLTKGH